jgi:MYXO-CTERM domain-containing protein
MHTRRLAAIILGAWLGGSLLMMAIPARNLASVDELLQAPSPKTKELLEKAEEANARPLLAHHASEVNRWMTRSWEQAQLGLGVALLLCLFFGIDGKRYTVVLCLLMLAAVAFLRWFLTPEMEKLAEAVDFAVPDQPLVARDRLWSLRTAYSITDTIKLALGLLLAAGLLSRRRRRHSIELD